MIYAEAPTLDKPLCPQCWRREYMERQDADYWWACRGCGHRATTNAVKKTLRKWRQRQP